MDGWSKIWKNCKLYSIKPQTFGKVGGQNSMKIANVICERPLSVTNTFNSNVIGWIVCPRNQFAQSVNYNEVNPRLKDTQFINYVSAALWSLSWIYTDAVKITFLKGCDLM